MNKNRTEWVIHIWGKKRDILELNDIEKFHIDMLKQYKEMTMLNISIVKMNHHWESMFHLGHMCLIELVRM